MKKKNNLPKSWSDAKAKRVIRHYEQQSDEAAIAEDEAAYRKRTQSFMAIPIKLVPVVRKLVARRKAS